MARPLRRVVIGLALRLGIAPREVETWSMADIRDCFAMLRIQSRPTPPSPPAPSIPTQTTDDELIAAFAAVTRKE